MNEQTYKEITNMLTNSPKKPQKKPTTQLLSHVDKVLFFSPVCMLLNSQSWGLILICSIELKAFKTK